jgi:MscS family membrane protein
MADARIENYSMRDTIRMLATLGLRGDTKPDQVEGVAAAVRELLASHSRVSQGNTRVRLVGVGDGTLYLEVMAYITTRELNEFMAIREEILLRVVEIVERSGAVLATPTVVLRGQLS